MLLSGPELCQVSIDALWRQEEILVQQKVEAAWFGGCGPNQASRLSPRIKIEEPTIVFLAS
jgi:hypothetical protein